MRRLVPVLCLLAVSACAGGTEARLTGDDAKGSLAAKDHAVTQLATTEITLIQQQAQAWSAGHAGSMAGFAEDLQTSQPSVAAGAIALTDASVSIATGTGSCLTVALPNGAPATTAC